MDVVVCGSCKVSAFIIQLCSDLVHLHEVEKILYTSKLMVPASNSKLKPFLIMVSGKNFVDGISAAKRYQFQRKCFESLKLK